MYNIALMKANLCILSIYLSAFLVKKLDLLRNSHPFLRFTNSILLMTTWAILTEIFRICYSANTNFYCFSAEICYNNRRKISATGEVEEIVCKTPFVPHHLA